SDYSSASGSVLIFNPGETSRTVSITVDGDILNEADENFTLNLFGGANAGFADAQGVATILNDDSFLSVSDFSITETDSGQVAAQFLVTLSNPSSTTVTVDYASSSGIAI